MLKRIFNFLCKDMVHAIRDNMILYGFMFPIILAFLMSMFIPSIESMRLTVAVEKNVEQKVLDSLKKYAKVEIYENQRLVQERVERNDDLAGIVKDKDQYVILLEGNESGEAEAIAGTLMRMILSDKPMAQYKHISLGKTYSKMRGILGSLLLLTSILIGGYVVGFQIVDEKETRVIGALAVSPLKIHEFFLSHALLVLIVGMVLAVGSSFIFVRGAVNYGQIIWAIATTAGVGLMVGFIIGGLAGNLISAIAIVKFLMLIFMGVPIVSLFVPLRFQWVFYPFPHYWAFQAYQNIFNVGKQHVGFMTATIITLLSSSIVLALLIPMLRRRLKFR